MMDKKDNSIRPIFIIGAPRSGSTVLTWCLGQHPNILPIEEIGWIGDFGMDMEYLYLLGTRRDLHSYLGSIGVTKREFHRYFGKAIDDLIKQNVKRWIVRSKEVLLSYEIDVSRRNYMVLRSPDDPKSRWVDGAPANTPFVYGLLRLFPGAKFIHILRDPVKVAKSLMNFSSAGARDISEKEAYDVWLWYVKTSVLVEEAFGPDRVLRILHADLIKSPAVVMKQMLEFVDEPYHPDCLLPLNERINSSKPESSQKMKLSVDTVARAYEAEAIELYKELLNRGQAGRASLASLKLLRKQFLEAVYNQRPEAFSDVYKDEQIIKLQEELKFLPPVLIDYGPKEIYAGEGFNVQHNGNSAMWAVAENATRSTIVVLNGRPLKSIAEEGGKTVTASVPKELYSTPGEYALYLLNTAINRKSNELRFVVNLAGPADRDRGIAVLQDKPQALPAQELALDALVKERNLRIRELQDEVEKLGAWGKELDDTVRQRDQRIQELQDEVEKLGAWGKELDGIVRQREQRIEELKQPLNLLKMFFKQLSGRS